MARARGGVSGAGLRRGLICSNCSGPVSVLTFDTFQRRTEAEAEWLKAGGPYRDAEFGKAEVGNGRADCTRRRTEPGRIVHERVSPGIRNTFIHSSTISAPASSRSEQPGPPLPDYDLLRKPP